MQRGEKGGCMGKGVYGEGLISYVGERMLLYTTDSAYHCVSDVPMCPFRNNTESYFIHL